MWILLLMIHRRQLYCQPFDPIRREVARVALEKLIVDGRIHPARIEEMVEKAQKEVSKLDENGENCCNGCGSSWCSSGIAEASGTNEIPIKLWSECVEAFY